MPIPRMKRPSESDCSDIADIASIAGLRAPSCVIAVPSRNRDVARGEIGDGSERVVGPELGHPHRVGSQALGLHHEVGPVLVVRARR